MSLDVLFQSLGNTIRSADNFEDPTLLASLAAADSSEAQFFSARNFLDNIYGEPNADRGRSSRAQTPMISSSRAQTPMTVWHALYFFSWVESHSSRREI
jgi:hypothetical protein